LKKAEKSKYLVEPVFDADGVQQSAGILRDGKEEPDPVPMAVPLEMQQSPQLDSLIRQFVRRELSAIADANQYDSFEEAEDFGEDEDDFFDALTPYEKVFDPGDKSPPVAVSPPANMETAKGEPEGGSPTPPPPADPKASTST
jgi:hypothetical protein